MKLTKYGHSCIVIENNNEKIVIDPGDFTELPEDISNVLAVVCTHQHADHTDSNNIQKIIEKNPEASVYLPSDALSVLDSVECMKVVVDEEASVEVGGFRLTLYPNDHAIIWQSSPCKNLRVKVDDFYYYPGDSFETIPDKVTIAGVPVSAPWLKMSEAIEFARKMNCEYVIPVHNGLLNDTGNQAVINWLNIAVEDQQKEVSVLKVGESIAE